MKWPALTGIELLPLVKSALEGRGVTSTDESELGDAVASLLDEACLRYQREVFLDRHNRLDFLLEGLSGGLALELKTKGGLAELLRQVDRYVQFDHVQAVLIVTTSRRLCNLPKELRGKSIGVVYMGMGL